MSSKSEFREYENGIADIVAAVVGENGTVKRNVKISSLSGGTRQIDVFVEGTISGIANARVIVDCKKWKTRIDKADVDKFIGLLDDVGADIGLLISSAGASAGAVDRAKTARGVRVKALSLDELNSWRPPGTVFSRIEIPISDIEEASKALREKGLRVAVTEIGDVHAVVEVFRHYGLIRPDGPTVQAPQHELTEVVLNKLPVEYRLLGVGVIAGGGTPNHRWLDARIPDNPMLVKLLAATEEELEKQLTFMASQIGVPIEAFNVEKPEGWPFGAEFPF